MTRDERVQAIVEANAEGSEASEIRRELQVALQAGATLAPGEQLAPAPLRTAAATPATVSDDPKPCSFLDALEAIADGNSNPLDAAKQLASARRSSYKEFASVKLSKVGQERSDLAMKTSQVQLVDESGSAVSSVSQLIKARKAKSADAHWEQKAKSRMARWKAASSFTAAAQRSLVTASDGQLVEAGQLWVYVLTATVCCVALVCCPHRTYKNGMRPDNGLDRAAIEKVQVKLFSMQKAGMALEQMSCIVVRDARRLVAMLPPGQYRWTDGKLQLSTVSLHTIMQWQAVGGQYLQQLS